MKTTISISNFQIVEICHLIYCQITIDIFFIDWERPRARNLVPRNVLTGASNSDIDEHQPVSIWRTYFVANEWNEIQTKRKLNTNIQLLTTVLILKVISSIKYCQKNYLSIDTIRSALKFVLVRLSSIIII